MMRALRIWPAVIICSTIAAAFVNFVDGSLAIRPIIIMWFLFVCPGMTLVRFLRLRSWVVEGMLALALSLSVDALLAGVQLYAGLWSPDVTLLILCCLCLGGAFIQVLSSDSAP